MQNIDKEEDKKVLKNQKEQKLLGSGGIRTHASMRLVPKTSALDRSATLPICRKVAPYKTISVMKSNP